MLFPYLIKVSLLLAALTLGYRWLIQFETFSRLNRVLLWLNVAAAWLLPLIPLAPWGPVKVQQEFHQNLPALVEVAPAPIGQLAVPIMSPPAIVEMSQDWSVSDWLLLFYLVVVLGMAGRFLMQVGNLVHSLHKAPAEPLEAGIRLVRDTSTTSPYSFFRWIVCNPDNHTPQDLQQILAHESEHVRLWHSADLLLAELQRIALWFNPFAWVHQRLVQGNLEYLADRAVLDGGHEKKQYQLNLLKTALQTNELPLTNSFAQSLLKKRIRMMNRKPSRHWVWGKYALLLSVLYLSSAFVAPYKQKLVEIAPEAAKPLVSALVEEEPVAEMKSDEIKEELPKVPERPELSEPSPADMDTLKDQPRKWVLEKGDTLFWAIPARATLSDLKTIQEEIANYGGEMMVSSFKYDPLQHFLTSISIKIKQKGGSGTLNAGGGQYSPIKGCSGYLTKAGNLGIGSAPPVSLKTWLQQDYQAALDLKKENSYSYVNDSLEQVMHQKGGGLGSTTYLKRYLEGSYAETILQREGIGKSESGTLRLTDVIEDADFLLDGVPTTIGQLNLLPFEQLNKVTILKAQNGKKIIQIFTN